MKKYTNESLTTKQRFIKDFVIGAVSQGAALFCCTPLQRYQMILIQQENIKYKTYSKPLLKIWLDTVEGINNLWRSHPDDVRYIFQTGLLFSIHGYYKTLIPNQFFLQGALTGLTHLFIIYPFVLTKLKLQQPQLIVYENNFISQIFRIGKTQGFLSLYQGFFISGFCASLNKGIYFGGYDYISKQLKSTQFDNFITKILASYIITTIAELISYPFEISVKNTCMQQVNKQYLSQLAEVVGRYRTIKASLVIYFYSEFFQLYEMMMKSFILDQI